MRKIVVILLVTILGLGAAAQKSSGESAHPEALTANDLAEVLGVCWWTVKLPDDLKAGDQISLNLVSADGVAVPGGGKILITDNASGKITGSVGVYSWWDSKGLKGSIRTTTGFVSAGYFSVPFGQAIASGGPGNGVVLNPEDILRIFDPRENASMSDKLEKGQYGLKLVITRKE